MKYFLFVVMFFGVFAGQSQVLLKQSAPFAMDVPSAIIFSNGQKILVGSYDNKIYQLNPGTGAVDKEFTEHKGFVLELAYSPKQNLVASAGWDNRIIIWDAASMTKKIDIPAHADRITSLSFSPDGTRLVSGSEDKTIVVWDVMTGGEIFKITDHTDAVTSVAYSKDGNSIVSGGWDKLVMIHSGTTGKLINTYKGHRSSVNSVDFSYKGNLIVSGSDDNSIIIWRTDSVKTVAKYDYFSKPVTRVCFFPGDNYIFCAEGTGDLKVYNLSARSLLSQKRIHDSGIRDMYIDADKGLMITTDETKVVKWWNINEFLYYDCVKSKTKNLSELNKPKGEFETTEMYEKRMGEYERQKGALVGECIKEAEVIRKAEQEQIEKQALSTYAYVIFPVQSLGTYNADSQEYPFKYNNVSGIVRLGLEEAKSFKENMAKAKVKAIKRVVNGQTEYINTEFIHPVSGKSIPFGRQITGAEDPVLGKFLQTNH